MMNKREPGIKAKIFAERLNAGPLSDVEAGELEAWLAADPKNSTDYRAALDAMPGDVNSRIDNVDGVLDEFYQMPTTAIDKGGKRWQLLAAAFLIGILVSSAAFIGWQSTPKQQLNSIPYYQTAIGERQDIKLPDGSNVTLNTNSRILVDFAGSHRKIILDRGEVFFDVRPDKNRPFTVDAGARTVTVLGTKFNVQLFPDEMTVSVVEGTVALHGKGENLTASDTLFSTPDQFDVGSEDDNGRYRLKAGIQMTVSLDRSQYTAATTNNVDQFDSWRNGVLVFDDQPLRKVVRDINRYDERTIVIDDSAIKDLKFSGVFQIDRTDSILTALTAILPIQVVETEGRVSISGSDGS